MVDRRELTNAGLSLREESSRRNVVVVPDLVRVVNRSGGNTGVTHDGEPLRGPPVGKRSFECLPQFRPMLPRTRGVMNRSSVARRTDTVDAIETVDEPSGSEDATIVMQYVRNNGGKAAYVGIASDHPGGHHTPLFDVDEEAIPIGITVVERTIGELASCRDDDHRRCRPTGEKRRSGEPTVFDSSSCGSSGPGALAVPRIVSTIKNQSITSG